MFTVNKVNLDVHIAANFHKCITNSKLRMTVEELFGVIVTK